MGETATNELVNTLNDPEEPLTQEVEEAAVGVAGCLKNVLKSASGASQGTVSSKVNPFWLTFSLARVPKINIRDKSQILVRKKLEYK